MVNQDFQKIRRDYISKPINKLSLASNPFVQFELWMNDALSSDILDPTAATLSTVDKNNIPSSRIILIKEITKEGFIFYTNYTSHKGQDLELNPNACLLFYWDQLHRQIRITGTVKKIERTHSEAYFSKRPIDSQLVASISQQSRPVESRQVLEERLTHFKETHTTISCPEHWGGYCLYPTQFEFWQGGLHRLHDRFSYQKPDTQWAITQLQP